MKFLISGGTGLIGNRLFLHLKKNNNVIGCDVFEKENNNENSCNS